ncbi:MULTISPECIES: ArsR/SmtB family transcription factor [Chryseobacterium]|uniref:DNA-binding transcriptional ArsR family regulator n=1 Tax=Chryseobacterium camelliae TaxID=1265445 RepID=A0ABU0TJ39_9FLAO|nr:MULTISPECIES: metalloregulator ArsR/SmtB family transcription factor [Chryseobacterium]MDT3409069.1 DNA-binding transcriptional ArsR family regulator [Pseudacidovorax intermedius]MDQ1097073.1 DNA-binding transcriptional ArsR family regulator [Chryseobacterium camelliae]MDQ1101011.1 DNA-binding transcriptional ArsR family regulator [Chryseobacterium sp. SORGH_AS_1048]MDR6084453.1 DNA-binding transcriptional ArsR family regulator [Chryseobacterium sp. SORGH_AS_0909]MDR6132724.1 DNA-binding tr
MKRDIFHAIADPTRRAIILLVSIQSMTPNTIAENFEISRQAVSKHLKVLSECDAITQEQKGREVYYKLNHNKMKEIADFIEPFRKMWDDKFNSLENLMKNHKQI